MTTLLIDADVTAYRAAFSLEVALEIEPGYWTWHCDINKVKAEIKSSIDFLLDRLEADKFKLCLSDDFNFRKDVLPTYKNARVKVKRPLVLKPIREWLFKEFDAISYPLCEGDDVLGILQTDPNKDDDTIIVSTDKDLKTIPGKFFKDSRMWELSEEQANYFFYYQTLIGDAIDGYTGIPGIGPKKASEILGQKPSWITVRNAYTKNHLSEEDAIQQARCARILRYTDYDHENKKPILWNPPQ